MPSSGFFSHHHISLFLSVLVTDVFMCLIVCFFFVSVKNQFKNGNKTNIVPIIEKEKLDKSTKYRKSQIIKMQNMYFPDSELS